jgi:arylsulfatase A-like enzyme
MTDHGISHARGKRFLYDEGTYISLVVRGPGIPKGKVRADLIELIDITPTSLAAARIPVPSVMQAKNVFAENYAVREFVFVARDRCDEMVERIRSVRSDRFLYIRNFYPQRPHLQPNAYKDGKSIVQPLRSLHDSGKLDPLQEKLLFSPTRLAEELYEWTTDRWQVKTSPGTVRTRPPWNNSAAGSTGGWSRRRIRVRSLRRWTTATWSSTSAVAARRARERLRPKRTSRS